MLEDFSSYFFLFSSSSVSVSISIPIPIPIKFSLKHQLVSISISISIRVEHNRISASYSFLHCPSYSSSEPHIPKESLKNVVSLPLPHTDWLPQAAGWLPAL